MVAKIGHVVLIQTHNRGNFHKRRRGCTWPLIVHETSLAQQKQFDNRYVLLNMLIRMNPINVLGLVPVTVPVTYDT